MEPLEKLVKSIAGRNKRKKVFSCQAIQMHGLKHEPNKYPLILQSPFISIKNWCMPKTHFIW